MFRLLMLLMLLSACNTPSQPFRGAPAMRVTVDGSTFDVRVNDNRAEAIRVNTQYAPRFGPIRERARMAMAQVSGCKVVRVDGDQALATGVLNCRKGARQSLAVGMPLQCSAERPSVGQGVSYIPVDVACYPT
ncbi:MAG: hypothetical protein WBB25_06095 [Sulfitobacter sp.]